MYHSVQVRRGSATALLDWSREGLFDNEVAHLFLSLIHEEKEARVKSVSEKPRSKAPPIALHTVELLRSASSKLHMGPKQAMDVAERLYTEVSSCLLTIQVFLSPSKVGLQKWTICDLLKLWTVCHDYI